MISTRESLVGKVKGRESLKGVLNTGIEKLYPVLENLEVTPMASEQVFTHPNTYGYDQVKVKGVTGETLHITPSKDAQKFNGLYSEVNVDKLVTSELTIIPTTETQTFTGLYEKVNAHPVTSDIDSNIVADNIKSGVEILGVTGTMAGGKYKPRAISFYNYTGTDLTYELENLDTSELNSLYYTFYRCRNVTEIDLSKHDLSKVKDIGNAFAQCISLKKLDIRTLDSSIITSYTGAFNQLPSTCVMIVKDEVFREWFTSKFTATPIIKTVAEYENS